MVQLRDDLPKLTEAGVQIVGISYDSPEILKKFSDSSEIPFPLLSDTNSEVIKAFGIHNQRGLPHPGTIVVDRDGVIRAKIFIEGYRDRHDTVALLDVLSKLNLE